MPNDSYTYRRSTRGTYTGANSNQGWEVDDSGSNNEARAKSNEAADVIASDGSSTQVKSGKKAGVEFKQIEFNTLEGELQLIPTREAFQLRVGNTINLDGFGDYLSGQYFVSKIRRTLGGDGCSLIVTVIKTGFADKIKDPKNKSRKQEVEK